MSNKHAWTVSLGNIYEGRHTRYNFTVTATTGVKAIQSALAAARKNETRRAGYVVEDLHRIGRLP